MELRTKIDKYIIFLLLVVGCCKLSFCFETCRPKIAVIGAGIGGASASHYVAQLFGSQLYNIHVFESDTVGGRLATVVLQNKEFEAGGAIIHPRNKYMVEFAKLLKLDNRPPIGFKSGIWNGDEFVFVEGDWDATTIAKLFYRYGTDPYYLHKYIDNILSDFEKIYKLQDDGVGFENVTAMLGAMNFEFKSLLQKSIRDHMRELGYKQRFVDEIVEATLVVNYGQDTDVQAFVSSVSVAGAGFDLWGVKSGNKQVPIHLLTNNKKATILQSTVRKIRRLPSANGPRYEVFYLKEGEETSDTYDIVIIAAPMTSDQKHKITFEGLEDVEFEGEYQTTYATFVAGNLNHSYFGLEEKLGGILSCNPAKTVISSVGQLSSVEGELSGTPVWKIFTREQLENSSISRMFTSVEEKKEIKWKAYPRYSSTTRLEKFKLDEFLYHVNAVEWAASAMEMSAIGGRNVAILAFNDFKKKCSSDAQSDLLTNSYNENFVDHTTEL